MASMITTTLIVFVLKAIAFVFGLIVLTFYSIIGLFEGLIVKRVPEEKKKERQTGIWISTVDVYCKSYNVYEADVHIIPSTQLQAISGISQIIHSQTFRINSTKHERDLPCIMSKEAPTLLRQSWSSFFMVILMYDSHGLCVCPFLEWVGLVLTYATVMVHMAASIVIAFDSAESTLDCCWLAWLRWFRSMSWTICHINPRKFDRLHHTNDA